MSSCNAKMEGELISLTQTDTQVWHYPSDMEVVHKHQPKYLTDNEYAFLTHMRRTGWSMSKDIVGDYVPWVERNRNDVECLRIEYIEPQQITDVNEFMSHLPKVLSLLEKAGIRHGDLTIYAVIPHNNRPYLIDFAESRWISDPIPPKRPEPDAVLLERAMRTLCTKL